MKLFEVIYSGRGEDRNDGDTIYLVRAPDFMTAVEHMQIACVRMHHPTHAPHFIADRVNEIGIDSDPGNDRIQVIRGPYFEPAFVHGNWPNWWRVNPNDPGSGWEREAERE